MLESRHCHSWRWIFPVGRSRNAACLCACGKFRGYREFVWCQVLEQPSPSVASKSDFRCVQGLWRLWRHGRLSDSPGGPRRQAAVLLTSYLPGGQALQTSLTAAFLLCTWAHANMQNREIAYLLWSKGWAVVSVNEHLLAKPTHPRIQNDKYKVRYERE